MGLCDSNNPTPPASNGGATPPAAAVPCPSPNPCEQPRKSDQGGSTTVQVDDTNKKIIIKTKLEYLGPDATDAYAAHAKDEIEKTWSGKMMRNGVEYTVEVQVETKVNPNGTSTPGYDPIKVDASVNRMNQTLFGAGEGNQTPAAADPTRRRIAHEYGHTLGLPDEYHDAPDGSGSVKDDPTKKNNIMAETWEDDGKMPHPHPDHYDKILQNYGCT